MQKSEKEGKCSNSIGDQESTFDNIRVADAEFGSGNFKGKTWQRVCHMVAGKYYLYLASCPFSFKEL